MIDEEATYKTFGYYSTDWAPKSNKKIIAVCDDCGKIRAVQKSAYRALCKTCSHKGAKSPQWKGGKVKRICEFCEKEFPTSRFEIKAGRGRFCSRRCFGKWCSKYRRGENNPNWKNGASVGPYCFKWNEPFREYIRDKFGRVCFLCPTTEEENGQRLSVHHVNYNKNCGCDEDSTCQFVPLCRSCNSKVNANRKEWEAKIKAKMQNKLNGWYI